MVASLASSRRRIVQLAAGFAACGGAAQGQAQGQTTGIPPSTVTVPPRECGPHAPPAIYPDPDVIVVDPSFAGIRVGNVGLHRVATGFQWAEGPAWSSQGHYLVFSDVSGDTQYRFNWDDRRVTAFRKPSFNSNGNAFDLQGRQISTQDYYRRVVRWEHDGTMTVIADTFDGKPLNSPNDLVAHPDGSIWFTDPPYGDRLTEGRPDDPGGPANAAGKFNPRTGAENVVPAVKRELPNAVYRWDPAGKLEVVVTESDLADPNGICFAPDYKTLYVISTGKGPGDTGPGGNRSIYAFDVNGTKLNGKRVFTDMKVDGVQCGPDGMRADTFGNLWCSSNAPLGYAGVLVFSAEGKLLGRIRLPEICANVAFGGPKHDHLFMTASQSLYMLRVGVQGAAPG
jgi:gluconolactonase